MFFLPFCSYDNLIFFGITGEDPYFIDIIWDIS